MKFTNRMIILSIILLSFALSGCNKNRIFHEVKNFKNLKWEKSNKVNFEVLIDNPEVKHELFLNLRYIQGFPYKYLHLTVSITDPEGKTKTNDVTIEIISDNKEYIGDGAGSYWDLDYPIPEYPFTKKGKYKISIEHEMKEDILSLINELGISVFMKE